MASHEAVTLQKKGNVAIITLNQPKKLNAMNQENYFKLASLMHQVAADDSITITVLAGTGRFFSAGADVSIDRSQPPNTDPRKTTIQGFVANNLHITHAFYAHPKILVAALNGPCVGLSAAIVAHADFVYAAPHAYLLTPFSSLGLISEGNASITFVQRLGIAKANEALIMSKKITCEELVQCNFINKVIDAGSPKDADYSDRFLGKVLAEVDDRLGSHLNSSSMLHIKKLIRGPMRQLQDSQGAEEVLGGVDRFLKGIPQKEFARMASGEKKHKL